MARDHQAEMRALLEAARVAAFDRQYVSVLRGAPSHTGAELLKALDQAGWRLVPCGAESPEYRAETDRINKARADAGLPPLKED